jgi:hypothetical protein
MFINLNFSYENADEETPAKTLRERKDKKI